MHFNILTAYSNTILVCQSTLLWSLLFFLPKASATEYTSTRMDLLRDMKLENMNVYEKAINYNMKAIDSISLKTTEFRRMGKSYEFYCPICALHEAFISILPKPFTVFVQNKNKINFWNDEAKKLVTIKQVRDGKLCGDEKDFWVEYTFEMSKQNYETITLFSERKSNNLLTITANATTESEAGEDVGIAEVKPLKEAMVNESTDSDNNTPPSSFKLQFATKIDIIIDYKGIGVIRLHYQKCFSLINQSLEKIREDGFKDENTVFYKSDMLNFTIFQYFDYDQTRQIDKSYLSLEKLANYCGAYKPLVFNTYGSKDRVTVWSIADPKHALEPVMKWILCENSSNILHSCEGYIISQLQDTITSIDDYFRDYILHVFIHAMELLPDRYACDYFFSSLAKKIQANLKFDEYKILQQEDKDKLAQFIENCRKELIETLFFVRSPLNEFTERCSYVLNFCTDTENSLRVRNLVLKALINHLENLCLQHDYLSLDGKINILLGFYNNKYIEEHVLKLTKEKKEALNDLLIQIEHKEKSILNPENTVAPADNVADTVTNTNPDNVLGRPTNVATDIMPETAVEDNAETISEPLATKHAEGRYEILSRIENLILILVLRERFHERLARNILKKNRRSSSKKMFSIIKQICATINEEKKNSEELKESKLVFLCRIAILESLMEEVEEVEDDEEMEDDEEVEDDEEMEKKMQEFLINAFSTIRPDISLVKEKSLLRQICNDVELKKIILAQSYCLRKYLEDNFSKYYSDNYIDNCEYVGKWKNIFMEYQKSCHTTV